MKPSGHHRGTILLVIVQAWLIPCHGLTYAPRCLDASRRASGAAARHASLSNPLPGIHEATPRGVLSLRMSDQGDMYDAYGDEQPDPGIGADGKDLPSIEPYREEHTSGGSRFRDLLTRAKGEAPPNQPPPQPRRPPPPQGAVDYDSDEAWEERVIGSPDLPDLPLRNEMPGLELAPEMGFDGPARGGEAGVGGGRFQQMMQQAKSNEQRREAGMAPKSSPRGQPARPPPTILSKDEKDKALRAAVERQQKMMAKARGIDVDDPTLQGAELEKKKALSRAQAEASAGGYLPSSNAADDYLAQLKADSKKKHKEQQAILNGLPLPPAEENSPATTTATGPAAVAPYEAAAPSQPDNPEETYVRQKRTKATLKIQNKADVYMASLKGIKVEIPDNPYAMNEDGKMVTRDERPPPKQVQVVHSPKPERPAGPQQSYAEKLRLARGAKKAGAVATPAPPPAATAASVGAAEKSLDSAAAAAASSSSVTPAAEAPAPPAQRFEAAPASTTTPAPPPRRLVQEEPEGDSLGEDATQDQLTRAMNVLTEHKTTGLAGENQLAGLRSTLAETREVLRAEAYGTSAPASATSAAPPAVRQAPASLPVLGEDDKQAKMMQVMDLLTEHKTAGIVGEDRVAALRSALVATRDILRAETYGESAPSDATLAVPPAVRPVSVSIPQPASEPAPTVSSEDQEALRRCSALLRAHVHTPLEGEDLDALRDGLASSLRIVDIQAGGSSIADSESYSAIREPVSAEGGPEAVPPSVGGIQSVGGVLAGMEVSKRPERFEPESKSDEETGWTDGSLADYEKGVATKALGYLLKHRGGKGYGRGRVKGADADLLVSLLAEVTEIMQEEMVEN